MDKCTHGFIIGSCKACALPLGRGRFEVAEASFARGIKATFHAPKEDPHATRIRDLETALNHAGDHAKAQEARIKALESDLTSVSSAPAVDRNMETKRIAELEAEVEALKRSVQLWEFAEDTRKEMEDEAQRLIDEEPQPEWAESVAQKMKARAMELLKIDSLRDERDALRVEVGNASVLFEQERTTTEMLTEENGRLRDALGVARGVILGWHFSHPHMGLKESWATIKSIMEGK